MGPILFTTLEIRLLIVFKDWHRNYSPAIVLTSLIDSRRAEDITDSWFWFQDPVQLDRQLFSSRNLFSQPLSEKSDKTSSSQTLFNVDQLQQKLLLSRTSFIPYPYFFFPSSCILLWLLPSCPFSSPLVISPLVRDIFCSIVSLCLSPLDDGWGDGRLVATVIWWMV